MNNIQKVTKRLIDSVWTISYIDLGNDEIEIVCYTRDDPEGYAKEHEFGKGTLIEDRESGGRIVIGAIINGVEKKVVNPKFIFAYRG